MQAIVVDPLPDVEPATRDLVLSARAVAAYALDPTSRITMGDLASAAGITVATLREVMSSDAFRGVIMEEFEGKVMLALLRGMQVMDGIVNNDKASNTARVQAFAQVVRAHEVIARARGKADENKTKAADVFRKAMAQLDKLDRRGKLHVHASPGSPPVGEVAAEEVKDAG